MTFAGLDVAAGMLDLVRVDFDTGRARWHHVDAGPKGWDTARHMREHLPAGSWWDDVAVLAIERPMGHLTGVVWAQGLVIGAVLARVPESVLVQDYTAQEWHRALGLPSRADKLATQAWALNNGADHEWTEHACEALCVAHAAIRTNLLGSVAA